MMTLLYTPHFHLERITPSNLMPKPISPPKRKLGKSCIVLSLSHNRLFSNKAIADIEDALAESKKRKIEHKTIVKELKIQIAFLLKELNRKNKTFLSSTTKPNTEKKLSDLKIEIGDLEFQIEVLQKRLAEKEKKNRSEVKGEKQISSQLIDSLDLTKGNLKGNQLSEEQSTNISLFLKNLNVDDEINKEKTITDSLPQETPRLENVDFSLLLNRRFEKIKSTIISENIKRKALLLIKESKEYGRLFKNINHNSKLSPEQELVLNQFCFELKSNFTLEKTTKSSYYEQFQRILRLIKREKSLKLIKNTLPKQFIDLLLNDKKYNENDRLENIVITTISIILAAFQKEKSKSYLDLSILVGENLLMNINSEVMLRKLAKIQQKINNINIATQVKDTLREFQKKGKVENPLKILFQIGNLMLIALIEAGLLEELHQHDVIENYEENLKWYKVLNPTEKAMYLKELNYPKPGTLIYLTDTMKEIAKDLPEIRFLYAYNVPSTIKPINYNLNVQGDINYGGFVSNELLHRYPLIKKDAQQRTLTVLKQEFLDARNYLQNTPFGISIPCLVFYLECYQNNGLFSSKDDSVKRTQIINILETCLNLIYRSKQNKFYAPISLDFRARIYFLTTLFQYQGPEFIRILFEATISYLLTKHIMRMIISLFAIYYDKTNLSKSYEQHVIVFEEKKHLIFSLANIPNLNINEKLNKKYDFIKLCMLLKTLNFFNSPNSILNKPITTLISLDAKSSGLQLISLLCGSTSLAEKVNILKTNKSEYKEDIYTFVSFKVHEYITKKLDSYLIKYPEFLFFDNDKNRIFYDRTLWKRIIMIKGYAAGNAKLRSHFILYLTTLPHIKESSLKLKELVIKEFFQELLNFVKRLLPEISQFLTLAFLISKNAFDKQKILKWRTLNQTAEVTHTYNEINKKQYLTSYNSRMSQLRVNLYQKHTFAPKNKWAFPANLIQSCDATVLECILLEAKKQQIPIHGAAHDSILIRICDYSRIQDLISKVIKELFTYNNVFAFWSQFRSYINKNDLSEFDELTRIDREQYEKLINEVSQNKLLFVLS